MLRRFRSLGQKGLAKDTSWGFGSEATTMVVLTVSFTLLGRRLGPEGYGAFVGLYGLLGPAISINQSAVGLAIYERVIGRKDPAAQVGASCFSSTLVIGLVLSGIVVGLGTVLLPALPLHLIILFCLSELFITSILLMAISLAQSVRGFASASRLRILATSFRGFAIVVLAVFDQLTLRNLALGQMLAALVAFVIVGQLLRSELGGLLLPGRLDALTLRSIGTYASGISASSVQSSGDKVAMNTAGHVADAGLYGAAYRIIMLAQVPANALVHSTHMSFLDRDKNDPVALSFKYSMVALVYALVAALGLVMLAPLVPVLLGSEFEGTETIIRWLTPLLILAVLSPFPANGLLTYSRNGLRTIIQSASAAFAVALYVLLIPPFSWQGAVAASLIAELTVTVALWVALLLVRRQRRRADAASAVPVIS